MAKRNVSASNPTAVAYARSVLDLANERQQAGDLGRDLAAIRTLLDQNPSFASFLGDPGIGPAEKAAMLEKLFRGRAAPLVMNLLLVLNSLGRIGLLGAVADAYADLLD